MRTQELKPWKVLTVGHEKVVRVPRGRGEALRLHLESHGIRSRLSPPAEGPFDRLDLQEDADVATVQDIIDNWSR
jgi:hypothetical protein